MHCVGRYAPCKLSSRGWAIMPNRVQVFTFQTQWAPRYEVNAGCHLENQFSLSSFKWSIFFVSRCELHRGPFNSMGQLEIPSCLIPAAGMLVCVVTSSLVRELGGAGRGSEWHTLSSLTLAHVCPRKHTPTPTPTPPPPLCFLHPSFSLVLPGVKDGRRQLMWNFQKRPNLATCVTYGAGRRGGWGQATATPPRSFVTQPWLALTKQYPKNSPK